jgi:hypothetical protein
VTRFAANAGSTNPAKVSKSTSVRIPSSAKRFILESLSLTAEIIARLVRFFRRHAGDIRQGAGGAGSALLVSKSGCDGESAGPMQASFI